MCKLKEVLSKTNSDGSKYTSNGTNSTSDVANNGS